VKPQPNCGKLDELQPARGARAAMRRYATILFDFIEEAPAHRSDERVDPRRLA
jgi:hypothetical protein